ncbi:hypothetical protein [Crocosphaera sp.]|nr:hypothetical protein [Crocosphaera sp.]MDJ0580892.1 hypothetical protein [Crocosphaera sp.]
MLPEYPRLLTEKLGVQLPHPSWCSRSLMETTNTSLHPFTVQ